MQFLDRSQVPARPPSTAAQQKRAEGHRVHLVGLEPHDCHALALESLDDVVGKLDRREVGPEHLAWDSKRLVLGGA